jgi:hypothetical protein
MKLPLKKFLLNVLVFTLGLHLGMQKSCANEIFMARARSLIDVWLTAQNTGNLAIYRTLYAKKFTGVRQSGSRTVNLNLAGWIKDRTRMFNSSSKMEVSISDITAEEDDEGVHFMFTQRFKQGSYQDVGPKHLLISQEYGEMKIVREEMLASHLVPSHSTQPDYASLLVGTWATQMGRSHSSVLTMKSNGTYYEVMDDGQRTSGTWKVRGTTLTRNGGGEPFSCPIRMISKDELEIGERGLIVEFWSREKR